MFLNIDTNYVCKTFDSWRHQHITMKKSVPFFLVITGSIISLSLSAQQNRFGGSAIYNLSTRSLGFGLRTEIPIKQIDLLEGISVVPQVSYYPGFNPVSELYIGSSVHLNAYAYDRWMFYGLLNLSYYGWINNDDTEYRQGDFSNLGVDLGVGLSRKVRKCWYPFFEFRFNARWAEFNARLGIMHAIKCDRRGAVPCSKIPPQPTF